MKFQRRKGTAALADYMHGSRRRILLAWHRRVCRDPQLVTAKSLSFAQFTDSIPRVLDAFEQLVRSNNPRSERAARSVQCEGAADHGLNRWQQGFTLRELTREWTHLQCSLLLFLDKYRTRHRGQAILLRKARRSVALTCGEGASESVACYARLQENEAAGRMRDLLAAVAALQKAAQIRAEVLRQAAHDLRGSVGIISNVSGSLGRTQSTAFREDLRRNLDRAVTATRSLLTELLDLTRLEAGDDELRLSPLDASALLRELGEALRIEAAAHGLFLKLEGPAALGVTCDATKLRRIVQNLVLNAIRMTRDGGVTVRWCHSPNNPEQWLLEICDTGPGLGASHASPVMAALVRATELRRTRKNAAGAIETSALHTAREANDARSGAAEAAAVHAGPHAPSLGGEGIGLAIVKRLCDLLGAGIEVEPAQPTGIVFRIALPLSVRPPTST